MFDLPSPRSEHRLNSITGANITALKEQNIQTNKGLGKAFNHMQVRHHMYNTRGHHTLQQKSKEDHC